MHSSRNLESLRFGEDQLVNPGLSSSVYGILQGIRIADENRVSLLSIFMYETCLGPSEPLKARENKDWGCGISEYNYNLQFRVSSDVVW
jgi:hypothetical protein